VLVEKRQVGREEFLDILLAHDPSHGSSHNQPPRHRE
jgi:hypothetical protein